MNENRALLVGRFRRCVLDLSPASVLDVGCGDGYLLHELSAAGIPTSGVEFDADRVAHLQQQGLEVRQANASALPFSAGEFDWVLMRHVLHHLADPPAALTEAMRVTRSGLVIAEPWTELPIASQRNRTRIDQWLRARDRERGMVHGPNLTPSNILAALPSETHTTLEILAPLLTTDTEQLADEMQKACTGLEWTPELHAERDELLELATNGKVTEPGTAILVSRKL